MQDNAEKRWCQRTEDPKQTECRESSYSGRRGAARFLRLGGRSRRNEGTAVDVATRSRVPEATATAPTASKTKYTSKTSTVRFGRKLREQTGNEGTEAEAAMLTTVATSDARRGFAGPSISVNAAVPVPVMRPAEKPDSTRPTKSHPTDRR